MTTEVAVKKITVIATQDLTSVGTLHKAVTLNGAIAAVPALAGGLLKSKGASGESVSLASEGIMKGVAGAAVTTIGYPVTVTTSGFIIAASSGGPTIGKAAAAAASGDLFPIMADFANLGFYAG